MKTKETFHRSQACDDSRAVIKSDVLSGTNLKSEYSKLHNSCTCLSIEPKPLRVNKRFHLTWILDSNLCARSLPTRPSGQKNIDCTLKTKTTTTNSLPSYLALKCEYRMRWGERNKTSKQKRETFRTRVKSFFHRLNLWLDHFAEKKKQQQQPWTIKLHPQNIMFLDKEPIYASCLGTARKTRRGTGKR